jgi:hypothetical protein
MTVFSFAMGAGLHAVWEALVDSDAPNSIPNLSPIAPVTPRVGPDQPTQIRQAHPSKAQANVQSNEVATLIDLLPSLSPGDLKALATEVIGTPTAPPSRHSFNISDGEADLRAALIFTRWGEVDPHAALAFTQDTARTSRQWVSAIYSGWAAVDFSSAVKAARATFHLDGIDALLDQLPAAEAMPLAQRYRADHKAFISELLERWLKEDRPAALAWARSHGQAAWAERTETETSPETASTFVNQIAALPKDDTWMKQVAKIVEDWEQSDAAGARFSWITGHLEDFPINPVVSEAWKDLDSLPDGDVRTQMMVWLATRWVKDDPAAARAWLQQTFPTPGATNGAASSFSLFRTPDQLDPFGSPLTLMELSSDDPARTRSLEGAEAILKALRDAGQMGHLMEEVARLGAPGWINEVVSARTYHDPQETVAWLDELDPDGSRLPDAWAQAANAWLREEPDRASEWLSQLPPTPLRDTAIGSMVEALCTPGPDRDFPAALQWALQIGNPEAKASRLEFILLEWLDAPTLEARSEARQVLTQVAAQLDDDTLQGLIRRFNPEKESP